MRPSILIRTPFLRRLRLAILLTVFLGLLSAVGASATPWTADDLLHQERLCGTDLSADGRLAVWVVCSVAKEDGKERSSSTIHAAVLEGDLAADEPLEGRKLTRGRERIRGLALSPDGESLYFVDRHSTHPRYRVATVSRLARWTPEGGDAGTAEILDLDWPRGLQRGGPQPVEGGLVALLADGVYNCPAHIGFGGERKLFEAGAGALLGGVELGLVDAVEASEDGGTLLLQISGGNRPTQLYAARCRFGAKGPTMALASKSIHHHWKPTTAASSASEAPGYPSTP